MIYFPLVPIREPFPIVETHRSTITKLNWLDNVQKLFSSLARQEESLAMVGGVLDIKR